MLFILLYTRIEDYFKGHLPAVYRVLTICHKSSSCRSSRSLEKDIKGLKRKKRIKEEKLLKLKTLLNIHVKLCNI